MGAQLSTDRHVWDSVLSGDSRAFGVLFDRHRDRVFGHALRQLASRADAEDLTAITFLEVWRRRDHVRFVDDSLLPWLLVTTSNAARNLRRSRRRHARLLAKLPPAQDVPDVSEQVAQRVDGRPVRSALTAAIAALGPVDRELIALTAVEGFSLRQASAALGLSYGAAKTRMSRARRKLGDGIADLKQHNEGTTP